MACSADEICKPCLSLFSSKVWLVALAKFICFQEKLKLIIFIIILVILIILVVIIFQRQLKAHPELPPFEPLFGAPGNKDKVSTPGMIKLIMNQG